VIAAILLTQAAIGIAAAPSFDAPELPDAVLAEQRGGVRLPNGIDLALTVQTQTAVNGSIVLQTVFSIVDGAPTVTVLTPEPGHTVAAPTTSGEAGASMATAPTVTYDRQNGLQVSAGRSMVPVNLGGRADASRPAVPEGLQAIDASTPVSTDAGLVTATAERSVRSVTLAGSDLSITHFAGNAFGSAIANARNDTAIQTETTISLDLRNAGPDVLGSAMLRVEDVALGALGSRM